MRGLKKVSRFMSVLLIGSSFRAVSVAKVSVHELLRQLALLAN